MDNNRSVYMSAMPSVEFQDDSGKKINTYIDPKKQIYIGINQRFNVALDSEPTTGCDWEENYDDTLLNLVDDKYEEDEKVAGLAGNGGTQYFQFEALKAGQTEITLIYKQLWLRSIFDKKVFKVYIK